MKRNVIQGPWQPPPPRIEGRPFEALDGREQTRTLRFAFYDLRRYWSDLSENERGWLRMHIPAGVRVEQLSQEQRARVAGVALLVLRRRAGWAA